MGSEADSKGTQLTSDDAADMFGAGPASGASETAETQPSAEVQPAPESAAASQEVAAEPAPGQEVQTEVAAEGQSTVEPTPLAPQKVQFAGREFPSMAEAEKAYKEMQRYATQMHEVESQRQVQQQAAQQPVAASAPAPEPKFRKMKFEDFSAAVEKGPYEAITGLVEEHLVQSGLGADLIEQAQRGAVEQVTKQIQPLMGFISELFLEKELDTIQGEDKELFTPHRARVKELLKTPGNRFSPRDVWAYVLAKEVEPQVRQTLAQAKQAQTVTANKAKAVSAATRGTGAKAASAAPTVDPVDQFFGANKKANIPGYA